MAAGASAEPFWSIYTVHQNPEVYAMLESFRIGNLKKDPEANTAGGASSDGTLQKKMQEGARTPQLQRCIQPGIGSYRRRRGLGRCGEDDAPSPDETVETFKYSVQIWCQICLLTERGRSSD